MYRLAIIFFRAFFIGEQFTMQSPYSLAFALLGFFNFTSPRRTARTPLSFGILGEMAARAVPRHSSLPLAGDLGNRLLDIDSFRRKSLDRMSSAKRGPFVHCDRALPEIRHEAQKTIHPSILR